MGRLQRFPKKAIAASYDIILAPPRHYSDKYDEYDRDKLSEDIIQWGDDRFPHYESITNSWLLKYEMPFGYWVRCWKNNPRIIGCELYDLGDGICLLSESSNGTLYSVTIEPWIFSYYETKARRVYLETDSVNVRKEQNWKLLQELKNRVINECLIQHKDSSNVSIKSGEDNYYLKDHFRVGPANLIPTSKMRIAIA